MGGHAFGVIIIDDDEVDVEAISRSLLRLDSPPHVVVFQTASKALQGLQGKQRLFWLPSPFLILLELRLPGMTGLEFLEHIRKDERLRKTPVLVISESPSDADKAAANNLGVAGYLRKSAGSSESKALAALIEVYGRRVFTL
jgi:CheY-like chemotaxis protein